MHKTAGSVRSCSRWRRRRRRSTCSGRWRRRASWRRSRPGAARRPRATNRQPPSPHPARRPRAPPPAAPAPASTRAARAARSRATLRQGAAGGLPRRRAPRLLRLPTQDTPQPQGTESSAFPAPELQQVEYVRCRHQVSLAIHRCRDLLSHLYVPVPESASQTSRPLTGMERANREVWSWARNASTPGAGGAGGSGVCASEAARVLPGYARDAAGRWLVVVQAAGLVVQPAHVDVCRAPGLPCPALAKCAQGGALGAGAAAAAGGRRGLKAAKASGCEQRFTPHHVVTWDPDAPERCPKLSVVLLPTACTCRLPSDS
ncbi:Uncharacterized protein GBIM_13119 [Gryllus bimaculatus]|nr:Uncharacterized protein GBIM_13119 [Gryllus bimaculatus]